MAAEPGGINEFYIINNGEDFTLTSTYGLSLSKSDFTSSNGYLTYADEFDTNGLYPKYTLTCNGISKEYYDLNVASNTFYIATCNLYAYSYGSGNYALYSKTPNPTSLSFNDYYDASDMKSLSFDNYIDCMTDYSNVCYGVGIIQGVSADSIIVEAGAEK